MKSKIIILLILILTFPGCKKENIVYDIKIIFLHQSTGEIIWQGSEPTLLTRVARRISPKLGKIVTRKGSLQKLFEDYNLNHEDKYLIEEIRFPENSGNYPFNYYNIWVKNAGNKPYNGDPTLEMLTQDYQVIIFKHCYPVSNIKNDQDSADINSNQMTISNYKLQYLALRDKLHKFPSTKFVLFTGAVQVEANITEEEAIRAREFFNWVRNEWDQPGDNIYLWDLNSLQTKGGLYLKEEYATSSNNSHPNEHFARKAVDLLFNRIIDIIENEGEGTQLTGEKK